ncbi:hypothetical protein [Bacterioplanoides sp.]|uniref:hypothetical protein n=1 Tax=Bacterioplanoides sp. TaxID=2066072 RepID=UPI003AFFB85B
MGKKPLSKILAGFKTTITELETFITEAGKKVEKQSKEIVNLEIKREQTINEQLHATNVSEKLKELIGE